MTSPPFRRHAARSPFNSQVLGVYKGPARTSEPPKLTAYRITLLRAIDAKEIAAGQGSFTGHWRWHGHGQSITVTGRVNELIRCGWAQVAEKHVQLTDAGRTVLPATKEKPE